MQSLDVPALQMLEEKSSLNFTCFTKITYPTTNGRMLSGSSAGLCAHCVSIFCTFGANFYAQSVLISKISASEISRKFIKSAIVGWVGLTVPVSVQLFSAFPARVSVRVLGKKKREGKRREERNREKVVKASGSKRHPQSSCRL